MSCENNLFIQTKSIEQKEYFLNILGNNQYFFQSFILNYPEDILIDDVTFDITSSDDIINCIFNIETPCVEFCKRICGLHGLNVQLVYYNKESNYSGKFQIYRNQVVTNETIITLSIMVHADLMKPSNASQSVPLEKEEMSDSKDTSISSYIADDVVVVLQELQLGLSYEHMKKNINEY